MVKSQGKILIVVTVSQLCPTVTTLRQTLLHLNNIIGSTLNAVLATIITLKVQNAKNYCKMANERCRLCVISLSSEQCIYCMLSIYMLRKMLHRLH